MSDGDSYTIILELLKRVRAKLSFVKNNSHYHRLIFTIMYNKQNIWKPIPKFTNSGRQFLSNKF